MQDQDMLNLWKAYGRKLDESLALNRRHAADIARMKAKSALSSMMPAKLFAIGAGLLWAVFVDALLIGLFPVANGYFLVSAALQVLLTKAAIGIYLYQSVLILRVSADGPITETQEKIARLQSSTLWCARLLVLQLPLWTIFYWSGAMFQNGGPGLWLMQAAGTAAAAWAAVWLFRNLRYENRDRKWFRLLFGGGEWAPMLKAMDLLAQTAACRQGGHD